MGLRGADARHLVGGNGHAYARAAQENAALMAALDDGLRHRDADVGVEHRLAVVRAEVGHFVALGQQMLLHGVLEVAGGFVAADGQLHGIPFITKDHHMII